MAKKSAATPSPVKAAADAVVDRLLADPLRNSAIPDIDFVSTGCTTLNCGLTGRAKCGIPKGTYFYLVGDSGAMKTWLAWSIMAEAARNKAFDKYELVYDGPEHGSLMDVPRFFGDAANQRVVPLHGTRKKPTPSRTVEEMYFGAHRLLDEGPAILIEDSMDALWAKADLDKFDEEVEAWEEGGDGVKGSYGTAKARVNSTHINQLVQRVSDTGSILIIISQTRDKIGTRFPTKTRSGGKALKFYAHLEVWTSVVRPLTARYHGKEREIGSQIKCDIQKNRVCGWEGSLEVPFLKGYGIDDVGGCIDYLLDEKHWKAKGKEDAKEFTAPEFNFTGTREQLVQRIQSGGDEHELSVLVSRVWRDIVANSMPVRKPRYT